MSKFTTLSALALAAAIVVGCSDSSDPFSPESAATPSFSAAAVTSFTATVDLLDVTDPGVETFSPDFKVRHLRGQVLEGPLTGGLGVGTGTVVVDLDVVLATGIGSARGTLTLSLDAGGYQGRFAGILNGDVFSGHFEAQGTGVLAGMKIQGTATDEADENVLIITGRKVVDHRP